MATAAISTAPMVNSAYAIPGATSGILYGTAPQSGQVVTVNPGTGAQSESKSPLGAEPTQAS